jgi:hypothetical protein
MPSFGTREVVEKVACWRNATYARLLKDFDHFKPLEETKVSPPGRLVMCVVIQPLIIRNNSKPCYFPLRLLITV